MKQKFSVSGMSCAACSSRVEKVVKRLSGVDDAQVSLLMNTMTVDYDPDTTAIPMIIRAVEKAGYGAEVAPTTPEASGSSSQFNVVDPDRKSVLEDLAASLKLAATQPKAEAPAQSYMSGELLEMRRRLVTSVLFLLPLFYIAMGHMAGLPLPGFLHGWQNAAAFSLTQFLLCLPIVRVNEKYFTGGFSSLVMGAPNMDSLIAVGSAASLAYGVFAMAQIGYGLGHGISAIVERYMMDLYFESAGMILTLITLGKYLETRAKRRTGDAIARLLELAPDTAVVVYEGQEYEIPTDQVTPGDILAIRPGGKVPVDGVVVDGQSAIDESALTGESMPVPKSLGDMVSAASVNKTGFLLVEALRVGDDTTLAQIIRLVEEASASKAPIARLADRIAGVFVPSVIGISAVTLIFWLILGRSWEFAMSSAIAVLVISCPCALGLATPVAIMAATGRGAEQGILIRSAEAFEKSGAVDTVVLDKTGTVTEGKPQVTDIAAKEGIEQSRLLALAASMEKPSEHPLAEAILHAAEEAGTPILPVEDFQAVFGKGVECRIDGALYWAGNAVMMADKGTDLTAWAGQADVYAEEGKTPLYIAREEECLGIIAVADQVKASSAGAISLMQRMGLDVLLLTGDNLRTAQAVGRKLGIEKVIAQVLPQDKEQEIRTLQASGRKVAMVGDGVNDAPALVRADAGIAIGAGTDIAIESADIVLMKNDLRDCAAAIQLSKATLRNIRQNLFWAFFYNIVGIPLAAGVFYGLLGWRLSPMFAAAAMSFSSVSVVTNALRLRYFKPKWGIDDDGV
ncbi:MAG: heavy metal translocating P-type ATPase [Clostridiales bacterium]|nr:heavy metal translocating P-type ATPase [Clostridiales bacterium]